MPIEQKVKNMIAEVFDIDVMDIHPETNLVTELEGDGLDFDELAEYIGCEFDIDIGYELLEKAGSVQAIVDEIKTKLN